MKLNRKWLMVIALVMSLTMATAGTLAYLTDRDSEVNVFTMGNVDIELNEDFVQDSELIPGVDIEKEVKITNIGKDDAWVWASIAIPSALDDVDNASDNVVHFNFSKDSVVAGQWKWLDEVKTQTIENVEYNVYTILYQTALKSGEQTATSVMEKVYLDYHIDIDDKGNMYHVEKGVVTPLNWNINTQGNPKIHVSAYGIQTETFATVDAGYAAYTAQWGDELGFQYAPTEVSTERELLDAIKAGESVKLMADIDMTERINIEAGRELTLDMNGHKLSDKTGKIETLIRTRDGSELTITGNGEIYSENHNKWMLYTDANSEIIVMNGTFVKAPYNWGSDCGYDGCDGGQSHTSNAQKLNPLLCGKGKITVHGGYFDCGILNPDYVEANSKPVVHSCMYPTINIGVGEGNHHVVIYGGTFVTANPVDGDDNPAYNGGSDNTKGNTLTQEDAFFLYGQTEYGQLPDGYNPIVEGKTKDGRTTYTYSYGK